MAKITAHSPKITLWQGSGTLLAKFVGEGISRLTIFIWAAERYRIIFHSFPTDSAIGIFFNSIW
jgi:hypothetical protein